jgi:hypothetical protein
MKLSSTEIADIIEGFLLKKDATWDWDDFISIRLSNPKVEHIRKICAGLPEQFPPNAAGQYCNEDGIEFLRKLLDDLRKNKAA